jgi:prepilin-type N-terminal cleavage/methylation domain-containing protein
MNSKMNRGVTLIELLVAVSVSGLLLIATLGILNSSTQQLGAQTSRAKAILIANQAMNAMTKDIRNSISVQADAKGVLSVYTLPGNTDTAGNYVPVWQNGSLVYTPGLQIHYRLSNKKDNSSGGTNLWREYWQTGGLLGLGSSFTPDTAWSDIPGLTDQPYFQPVQTLTFSNTGLPPNTIRVSVTVAVTEGKQSTNYTVSRNVYLSNHN